MAICRLACQYNTLDGCKVKAYGGVCPLTNTAQPITEYKMTNADRIRSMSDEELASMLKDYKDCSKNCIISNRKHCYQICEEESVLLKWLQQPTEDIGDGT